MNTFFLDQSVQKIFYIILKTEALVPAQVLLRCSSSNFSVHRTTAKHSFQSSIRYCMAPLYCSLYGAASDSVVPVLRDRGRESPTGQGGGRSMCARVLAARSSLNRSEKQTFLRRIVLPACEYITIVAGAVPFRPGNDIHSGNPGRKKDWIHDQVIQLDTC